MKCRNVHEFSNVMAIIFVPRVLKGLNINDRWLHMMAIMDLFLLA
jgi:hypothetical protein